MPKRRRSTQIEANENNTSVATREEVDALVNKSMAKKTLVAYNTQLKNFFHFVFATKIGGNERVFKIDDFTFNIGDYLASYLTTRYNSSIALPPMEITEQLMDNNEFINPLALETNSQSREIIPSKKLEPLGKDSIEQARAAIKYFYKFKMGRDGTWKYNAAAGIFEGNPAEDPKVIGLVNGIKKNSREDIKVKSRAITINELKKILRWLNEEYVKETENKLLCDYYIALFSLCFYCWLRIDEAFKIRMCDLQEKWETFENKEMSFIKLTLPFRKTDQYGSDATSYEIHDSNGINFNPLTHLRVFIQERNAFLTSRGWSFSESDYLFPNYTKESFNPLLPLQSPSAVSELLDKATKDLGLYNPTSKFTLHCFRRGGAQRAFYELNKTLTEVKAWGGWSKGENNLTLINYIVNEYELSEKYYGDLFSPYRVDKDKRCRLCDHQTTEETSHTNEDDETASTSNLRQMDKIIKDAISPMITNMKNIESLMASQFHHLNTIIKQQQQQIDELNMKSVSTERSVDERDPTSSRSLGRPSRTTYTFETIGHRNARKYKDLIRDYMVSCDRHPENKPIKDWEPTFKSKGGVFLSMRKIVANEWLKLGDTDEERNSLFEEKWKQYLKGNEQKDNLNDLYKAIQSQLN